MAFTLVVIAIAVAAGYARGGRISRLADARLRWSSLLFVGLAIQIAVDVVAPRVETFQGAAGTGLLVLSHLFVAGWIFANRYRPGILLVFLGLLLNAVVIAANGGMPVDPQAIADAGLPAREVLYGKHVIMTDTTQFAFLGDVFPIAVLRTVISIGDIVLAAGLVPLVGHLMTYRPATERRGGPREKVATTSA